MKYLLPITLSALLLAACAETPKPAPSILGETARSGPRPPVVDTDIIGVWLVKRAEMGGKPFSLLPEFELKINGDRYGAGLPSGYSDRGRIELFGDELAGQPRRMDVVGEVGPNKAKRIPALYRLVGRDLEIIYDLSGKERPADFISREGTQLFRVLYIRKM